MRKLTVYSQQSTAWEKRKDNAEAQNSQRSAEKRKSRLYLGEFALLGLVPEGFQLGAGNFGEGSSLLAGDFFHLAETACEFGAGLVESDFGIDVKKSGEIHCDEEDVA